MESHISRIASIVTFIQFKWSNLFGAIEELSTNDVFFNLLLVQARKNTEKEPAT